MSGHVSLSSGQWPPGLRSRKHDAQGLPHVPFSAGADRRTGVGAAESAAAPAPSGPDEPVLGPLDAFQAELGTG